MIPVRSRPANKIVAMASADDAGPQNFRKYLSANSATAEHPPPRVAALDTANNFDRQGALLFSRLFGTQTFSNGVTSVGEVNPLSLAISCQLFGSPVDRLASAFKSSFGNNVKFTPPLAGVVEGGGSLDANSSISLKSANRLLAL